MYMDTYYTSDHTYINCAILNFPTMESDDVILVTFAFVLCISEGYD